jgi:hypothetical protein
MTEHHDRAEDDLRFVVAPPGSRNGDVGEDVALVQGPAWSNVRQIRALEVDRLVG